MKSVALDRRSLGGAGLGRPVAAAALLFVGGGEARTHWIPDLPDAVEEVRARLVARAGAGATDSA